MVQCFPYSGYFLCFAFMYVEHTGIYSNSMASATAESKVANPRDPTSVIMIDKSTWSMLVSERAKNLKHNVKWTHFYEISWETCHQSCHWTPNFTHLTNILSLIQQAELPLNSKFHPIDQYFESDPASGKGWLFCSVCLFVFLGEGNLYTNFILTLLSLYNRCLVQILAI